MHSELSEAERDAAESKLVARQIKDGKDRAPSPFIAPPAVYPAKLKASGKTGSASVTFTIDPVGRVQKPNVVESTDPAFAEAALATIQRWRFIPAVKGGHAVSTSVRLPFTFTP
jgi:TonB family protein